LTSEEEAEILRQYADESIRTADILTNTNICRRRLQMVVEKHGAPLRRPRGYRKPCVVCGAPIPNNHSSTHPTCRDPVCSSLRMFLPELGEIPTRKVLSRKGKSRKWKYITAPLQATGPIRGALYRHEECGERLWVPSELERAVDASPLAKANPFSTLTDVPVALLLRNPWRDPYIPALVLQLQEAKTPLKALIRDYFAGDRAYALSFPILTAWQCSCDQHYTVIWTADTFPDAIGRHGVCTRCGTMPLEVRP
jgi:hypothetical protein